jgi:Ca-activated chloride channel family protein
MHLNAVLDFDLIAVESEDQVSVLLEMKAPEAPTGNQRPPGTLQLVLDRSGSMQGDRLDAAKGAIDALLARLDPTDNFGLVLFDTDVHVAAPAGPLADKALTRNLVRSIEAGATTNLSGGLLRGIQEARRAKQDGHATLVLLSDGLANEGITEPDRLHDFAHGALTDGVATSTIGVGLGYHELVMDAISRGGGGNAHFAEDGDEAGAAIASEVDHLLDQVIQAASIIVRPSWDVEGVTMFNDLPAVPVEGGFMVELGDFYSSEERKLLFTIDVPAMAGLGAVQVCELELSFVSVDEMKAQTITVPVNVNVVPGDVAAGRLPNATVRTELAFQRAQRAKREAADELRAGRHSSASRRYLAASAELDGFRASAPADMADELISEVRLLKTLSRRSLEEDPSRIAKLTEADRHLKQRKRGRRSI